VAARYHSLAIDPASLPAELEVTARSEDGVVMAVRHRNLPVEGFQFHPESILTDDGAALVGAFLARTTGVPA
jgi:anthranilate/para-aminobenzoate synthase component II